MAELMETNENQSATPILDEVASEVENLIAAETNSMQQEESAPQDLAPTEGEPQEQPAADSVRVRVGGVALNFPAGMAMEEIQARIAEFRNSDEFEQTIDKDTGAPGIVRAIVDGAANQDEKLASLRNYYQDATIYGEDNFLFTDPMTGKYTVYNPKGFEAGDVAGFAREGSVVVGSFLGSLFGFGGGFVVGAPTGPGALLTGSSGAVIGAGLGAAAGGSLYDLATGLFTGREINQSFAEAGARTSGEIISGAISERIGQIITLDALKRALGGGTDAAKYVFNKFASANITPTAGTVVGRGGLAQAEQQLKQLAPAAEVLNKKADEVMEAVGGVHKAMTQRLGRPTTPQGVGEIAKDAAKRIRTDVDVRMDTLENNIINKIGPNAQVRLDSVLQIRFDMIAKAQKSPYYKRLYKKPLEYINDLIETDDLSYGFVKELKSNLGRTAYANPSQTTNPDLIFELKNIYRAIGKDMTDSAKRIDPSVGKDVDVYNRYYSMYKINVEKFVQKIEKTDAPHKIYTTMMTDSRGGNTNLLKMKKNFKSEEWDDIAATVWDELGKANPGVQDATGELFSGSKFLTNFNKMSKEAKDIIFSGEKNADLRGALEDLLTQTDAIKRIEGYKNNANTGGAISMLVALSALGAGGYDVAFGDAGAGTGTMAAVGAGFLGARYSAKLLTNPSFVKWLATPIDETAQSVLQGVTTQMTKLITIAEAEPEISREIYQFISAMRPAPGYDINNQKNARKPQ